MRAFLILSALTSHLALLTSALAQGHAGFRPVTPPGLSANITYVNAGGSLTAAKAAAVAGTTIVVGPGLYGPNETNLFKNGVNWHFMTGTVISNNYSADVGCFDNSFEGVSGAVTCIISGDLVFLDNATVIVGAEIRGSFLMLSNPASRVHLAANTLRNVAGDQEPLIRSYESTLYFDVEHFDVSNGGVAVWWDGGTGYGNFKSMDGAGDSLLWCESGVAGNWYFSGEFMETVSAIGGAGTIYFKPAHAQNKVWINVKEIVGASVAAGYGGVLTVVTGKCYLTYQKLSGKEDTATPRALIEVQSGEVWLCGEKMTVTNNQHFVSQSGGKAWIRNQHWEDAGVGSSTRPYNYLVSGGTNYLQGGRANSLWGPWAKLTGGQLQIEDMTIDTLTSATLQPTNACLWITGGTPTVRDSVFISSCIFSVTNAAAGDLRVYGTSGLVAKSNITATLTVRVGTVTVDGTYVDR